ncbi:MAG TPA: hypothetical protein DGG95_01120, partial [Cytophagales bacterium]|nr:hypothetical protein [Cytophagales bacterium]
GANENTVITFSHDAKVEGQNVPAGSYGFFLVINSDNSGEVILSKSFKSWGSFFYDQAQDQLRAKIQLRDLPYSVESLTYDFMNATKYSAELVLNWEKKQFPVKIEFDVDKIVMANAKEVLKGQTGFNPQSFVTAAGYAMNNNIELEQGVKWIDQAITNGAPNPGNAQGIKYNLLTKLGKTSDAEKLFQNVITNSNENDVNLFAYQLSGQGLHDKAIEAFVSNTKRFPNSPNTWDSLGEGYANKGDKENAIKSFKKSLSMNPPSGVKANSEKFLKQFGAM